MHFQVFLSGFGAIVAKRREIRPNGQNFRLEGRNSASYLLGYRIKMTFV